MLKTTQAQPFNLDVIDVASPCSMSWDSMTGDDRSRHCSQCKLNVYNLSEMTRSEAEVLVQEREGSTCVRFHRRADGTVLTRDCPVGIRALRWKLLRVGSTLAALLFMLLLAPVAVATGWTKQARHRSFNPLDQVHDWTMPEIVMGDMCVPAPPTPPAANNSVPSPNDAIDTVAIGE